MTKKKILMVCLGNICRSPMAEGILRKKLNENKLDVLVDSAGTGSWHAGEHPDPRAVETAAEFGVDISMLVARQFRYADFESFDRIFVMDKSNYLDVISLASSEENKNKVELILNLSSPGADREVPDPWVGGKEGFIRVFKLLDEAISSLVNEIEN